MARKVRIDSGTRWPIDEGEKGPDVPVRAASDPAPGFVELAVRSTFSGVSIEGAVEGPTSAHAARGWPGAGQPEEIAERACVFGYDAVSITDVDTLAGMVRGHRRAKELGLRFIVGVEAWTGDGPVLLHAQDLAGYTHLCEWLTRAKRGREKGDIEYRREWIEELSGGLWATLLPPFADDAVGDWADAFGERLSVGMFYDETPEDRARHVWSMGLAQRYGIARLATSRAFLVDRSEKRFHDVLTCIRQGLRMSQAGQRLLPNDAAYLRSPDEMAQRFADFPKALARSREIAEACEWQLGELKYAFPAEKGGPESSQARLERLTLEGACRRYGVEGGKEALPEDVARQLRHEFDLISDLDVAPYFLTVYEIVEIARDKGILCQGRGSAANSAVCFCLGITSIDPVRMGLLFERFLSRERGEPPDIDVDFEHERREEVIQAIYEKWGRDHAAMVCNVIAFRGRSAVREVGKVFGLTETVCGKLSGLMWHSALHDITEARLADMGISATRHAVERTLTFADRLQGHPRHLGIHVGGFVLTDPPIWSLAPTEPARMEDRTVLPFDKDDVEEMGLFKMDVLGLGMLTCIRKGFDLIEQHEGEHYELHTIGAEDEKVYEGLSRADSIGVFQVESRAQMAMLPRLAPRSFYDLVIEVAIIRPGPIQGGMVHPYLRRRNGEEPVEYPHECLRPILERTLGIPLFQEQVMRIAVEGAGYSPGEADQLRRDMAAWKKTGKLFRHRDKLIQGFVERGIDQEFGERLFAQIKGFGEYGFPESHAASFAVLVYASAWIKTYHPAVFCCALLNSQPMGFYTPAQLVADAQEHGVEVRPVSVNHSDVDHTLERDRQGGPLALRLGLRLVKGLPDDEAQRIQTVRDDLGLYRGVQDVFRRADISLKGQRALSRSGALDGLTRHRRAAMFTAMQKELPLLARIQETDEVADGLSTPEAMDLLEMDYAQVGLSTGDHPMNHLQDVVRRALTEPERARWLKAEELQSIAHKTRAVCAGLVTGRQRPGTADGTCFVTLEDETGMTNVVVWGRDFDRWRHTVVTSPFLIVDGLVEREGVVVHLIAHAVRGLSERPEPFPYRSRDFH